MKIIIYLIVIFAGFGTAKANNLIIYDNVNQRANYVKKLRNVITSLKIEKKITYLEIQYVIPVSNEEFHEFYSYSYKGECLNAFERLNELFKEYATKRKLRFFILYLKLAEFVDGEFAEGYFESLEHIVKKNKTYYCRVRNTTSQKVRDRISDYFTVSCNSK